MPCGTRARKGLVHAVCVLRRNYTKLHENLLTKSNTINYVCASHAVSDGAYTVAGTVEIVAAVRVHLTGDGRCGRMG